MRKNFYLRVLYKAEGVSVVNDKFDRTVNIIAGITAGSALYATLPNVLYKPYRRYMLDVSKSIPPADNEIYKKAAEDILVKSGLKDKGVTLVDVTPDNIDNVVETIWEKSKKKVKPENLKIIKYLFKDDPKVKIKQAISAVAEGSNAAYNVMNKIVLVNKDKHSIAACHEYGHAVNATSKNALKALSVGRHVTKLLAFPVVFIGLLGTNKSKKTSEEKKTFSIANFINKHCGAIVFALLLPMVAEEGFASINAAKLAKNTLTLEKLKEMNRYNTRAWLSYVIAAVVTALTAQFAMFVKNKITAEKVNEKEMLEQNIVKSKSAESNQTKPISDESENTVQEG